MSHMFEFSIQMCDLFIHVTDMFIFSLPAFFHAQTTVPPGIATRQVSLLYQLECVVRLAAKG